MELDDESRHALVAAGCALIRQTSFTVNKNNHNNHGDQMNTTKRVLLRTSIVLALSALVSLWAMPETDLLAADVTKPTQANVHVPSGEVR